MDKEENIKKLDKKFSYIIFFSVICIVVFFVFIANSFSKNENLNVKNRASRIAEDINVQINKSIEKINSLKVNEDNIRKEIESKNSLEYFSNIIYIDANSNAIDFNGEIQIIDDFILNIIKSDEYNKAKI